MIHIYAIQSDLRYFTAVICKLHIECGVVKKYILCLENWDFYLLLLHSASIFVDAFVMFWGEPHLVMLMIYSWLFTQDLHKPIGC